MIIYHAIYEQLRTYTHHSLVEICKGVYGERVWFNKAKRTVVEMKYHDLLALAFKIENERFNNGVPFMPRPVLGMIGPKILPKDSMGNLTWLGKVEGIPFVIFAKHPCEVNRKVAQIMNMLELMEEDERKGYIGEMDKAFKEVSAEVKAIRNAAKALRNEARQEWAANVENSTYKWLQTCETRAYDMAQKEGYRINITNKYKKLLSLL